jgi:hypothetical protein
MKAASTSLRQMIRGAIPTYMQFEEKVFLRQNTTNNAVTRRMEDALRPSQHICLPFWEFSKKNVTLYSFADSLFIVQT